MDGHAAINFEVDGEAHDYAKARKDELMENCFAELGIFVTRIKDYLVHTTDAAEGCTDYNRTYVQNEVAQILSRNPCDVEAVNRLKARMKLFTIACWLEPRRIEKMLKTKFNIDLNLEDYISLVHHNPTRHKWIRGAKRLLKVKKTLSNGLEPRKLYASRSTKSNKAS